MLGGLLKLALKLLSLLPSVTLVPAGDADLDRHVEELIALTGDYQVTVLHMLRVLHMRKQSRDGLGAS